MFLENEFYLMNKDDKILKYGILQFARLLLVILLPLFIASFFKKDLLPLCVFISLFCVFLGFLLIYL